MAAESVKVEFDLTSHACIIRNLIEGMYLMIYVLNIVQRRERHSRDLSQTLDICGVPEQDSIASLSVSSSPARFLEICFRTVGNVEMNDKAHIRLVNTHSKGIRADHDTDPATLPLCLTVASGVCAETGMIERGLNAVCTQECRKFFRLCTAADIYDACALHTAADVEQLTQLILALTYYI